MLSLKVLLVAMLAGAEALNLAARPTVSRTSAVCMSENDMDRRGAIGAAVLATAGVSPAEAAELASKVHPSA